MLSHEEAPAMQPSADECPAAGQCQFLAGRLRAAADCDAALRAGATILDAKYGGGP